MSIAEFRNDLKTNALRNVYLFWGDEDYLRKRYINQIRGKLCDNQLNNIDVSFFEAEISIDDLMYACNTVPLFSSKRLVIAKNTGLFKSKSGHKSITTSAFDELLSTLREQTCIILDENNVNTESPLIKIINKYGLVVECGYQKTQDIVNWVKLEFRAFNKKIDNYLATYLVEQCSREMSHINNEIQKIVNYAGNRSNIEKADIESVCVKSVNIKIFDLADAMLQDGKGKALSILDDLIDMKELPVYIVLAIARHFRNLLKVKLFYQEGFNIKQIAIKLKLPEFVVRKLIEQSAQISVQQTKDVLINCFEADYAIKTGKMDGRVATELIISKHSKLLPSVR